MWYFEEECNCNHRIINFRSITFMINDSRIELRCRMVAYFHRKNYAIKTKLVRRTTQSNALTPAGVLENADEQLVSVTLLIVLRSN